jgi:hypothetical protein
VNLLQHRRHALTWLWLPSSSPAGLQGAAQTLAITHIFPCRINPLRAVLKEVPFCTEPFEGRPLRVTFRAQT